MEGHLVKLYSELRFLGFIGNPEFDGDIHQPNYIIQNHLGDYIGDVLKLKGFVVTEEIENKKTWIMFTNGDFKIGHRSLFERPETTSWFVSDNTDKFI